MVNPNEDSEFNDALRAHGILPPKPPSRPPSPDIPHITHADAVRAIASTADADQLGNLLEADNIDSDDERMFEDYRRRRIAEMRAEEKRGRFGSLEPLAREDFVREVTEGSKLNADGKVEPEEPAPGSDDEEDNKPALLRARKLKGTGVVVFLFKDSIPLSQHLRPLLAQLAAAHPETKFLSIPATMCIPNYPDKNVPTLLIYRNGDMVGNLIAGAGMNGLKTTVRELEALLIRYTAIDKPSAALRSAARANDSDDSDLDSDGGDVGTVNARSGGIRSGGGLGTASGGGRAARRGQDSDDDSDFDL
ncbi:Viral IAP-associated factor [Vanrija pseudolonga]|uniref:Viral IAP-associated factor n=1 Tax=Vanrija pseudolonga TaxID=143232 RepID=A0AAF1BKD0_9TREE|nr:Viral IAP-associated factor [Vanrija pseudolonga]